MYGLTVKSEEIGRNIESNMPRMAYPEPRVKHERHDRDDIVLVPDGNGNMVDPSFITRKYLGVTYHRRNKKWIAQASENGRSKYLGCFDTPEKAAQMYDAYVVSEGGPTVKTNFPADQIDPNMKPLVKRYRKRSRDVIESMQKSLAASDTWSDYMTCAAGNMMNNVSIPQQPPKKRRKIKDPTAPKGPRNAYMMYIQKTRAKLQKECIDKPLPTGNSFGSIGRELGRRWKSLSKEEKKEYEELAKEDKKRYEKEKKEYEIKVEKENKEVQQYMMENMDAIQQQYNEYLQLQSQYLQMLGYTPQQVQELMNYYAQASQQQQQQAQTAQYYNVEDYTDVYEQLGYTSEELQALQQMYYNAQMPQIGNMFQQMSQQMTTGGNDVNNQQLIMAGEGGMMPKNTPLSMGGGNSIPKTTTTELLVDNENTHLSVGDLPTDLPKQPSGFIFPKIENEHLLLGDEKEQEDLVE